MTECKSIQLLLRDLELELLSTDLQCMVADHLADCKACQIEFERSVMMDAAVSLGLESVPLPQAAPQRKQGMFSFLRLRSFRVVGIMGALFAGFALGGWFGAPIIHRWSISGPGAAPIRPEFALLGMPNQITQNTIATKTTVGPWAIKCDLAHGFASLDDSVTYSGGRSIKLVQRNGSGELVQDIPIPLPAGTLITAGAWVLTPRGGTGDNKYFTMSIRPSGTTSEASSYVLDESPNWRPVILRSTLAQAADSFRVILSVGSGYGNYFKWDWAMWVDDVFVGVVIPLRGECHDSGDELIVQAKLPPGYTNSMSQPASVFFSGYDERARNIAGKVLPSSDAKTIRLSIRSSLAVRAMHTQNPDTGGPPTGRVAVRLRYGQYSVPFEIGIIGR